MLAGVAGLVCLALAHAWLVQRDSTHLHKDPMIGTRRPSGWPCPHPAGGRPAQSSKDVLERAAPAPAG